MAYISIDREMKRVTNPEFLRQAAACAPELRETLVQAQRIVRIDADGADYPQPVPVDSAENLPAYPLGKGDSLCLDFGDHQVGYVTLRLSSVGSPQDAPAYFRLRFGEIAKELTEDPARYDGWISRSWIQEEYVHVDVLPAELTLPRRYAFRFMELSVIDTSLKWKLVVESAACRAVSAVSVQQAAPVQTGDELLRRLDQVSVRTLANCMQAVFEDGPKRDRRLWLGDLRLQARVNYVTFRNMALVRRCLYLFAALTRDDGRIGACLFTEPDYLVDDTFFFDYSLLFVPALLEYYQASGDADTLRALWPSALRQLVLAQAEFDETGLIANQDPMFCFIDWTEGLDKQAAAQAVYLYCAKAGREIAGILGDEAARVLLESEIAAKTQAAGRLWDGQLGLFVSGASRQVSYASQVWMILAGVVSPQQGAAVLDRLIALAPDKKMVSPYMNGYYVEALLACGQKQQALRHLKHYWGGMLAHGADTFWELYDPGDPAASPYGSSMVNSYCHAWSCTPAYFIRRFFSGETPE